MKYHDQWKHQTVVILASGSTLDQDDEYGRFQVDVVEAAHSQKKVKVMTVNDCYTLAPWADAYYAGDRRWWTHHWRQIEPLPGQKWTRDPGAKDMYNINGIRSHKLLGLCKKKGYINHGTNSGYQAINLAYHFGVSQMYLLGFDCKHRHKRHFFGDHPKGWGNANGVGHWPGYFRSLAKDLDKCKIKVYNCSPDTALDCWEQKPIEELI